MVPLEYLGYNGRDVFWGSFRILNDPRFDFIKDATKIKILNQYKLARSEQSCAAGPPKKKGSARLKSEAKRSFLGLRILPTANSMRFFRCGFFPTRGYFFGRCFHCRNKRFPPLETIFWIPSGTKKKIAAEKFAASFFGCLKKSAVIQNAKKDGQQTRKAIHNEKASKK